MPGVEPGATAWNVEDFSTEVLTTNTGRLFLSVKLILPLLKGIAED